jgi:protein-L-isoaspartate(D-aspartate) O-methyltransferase
MTDLSTIEQARFNMIEQQIRPWDVLNTEVLDLLKRVKREQFVPPAYAGLAFSDTELPLGHGQTMLSPKLEARLFQTCAISAADRVLEIGTGSGYMSALLGFTAAQVVSVQTVAQFVPTAQKALHTALLDNVQVVHGNGFEQGVSHAGERGWDVIVLSGSLASAAAIPTALLNTLTIGGRLIGVFGDEKTCPMMQVQRIRRTSVDQWVTDILFNANAPVLTGLTGVQGRSFVF